LATGAMACSVHPPVASAPFALIATQAADTATDVSNLNLIGALQVEHVIIPVLSSLGFDSPFFAEDPSNGEMGFTSRILIRVGKAFGAFDVGRGGNELEPVSGARRLSIAPDRGRLEEVIRKCTKDSRLFSLSPGIRDGTLPVVEPELQSFA
jgi:hypothetical protein